MSASGSSVRRRGTSRDRGQTGIDFLVGVGIFLLTAGFVFGFLPGMLAPFADHPAKPLVADRVANTLVGDTLVDAPDATSLNESATVAFFAATSPPLATRFDVDPRYHLNVTVERSVPGQATRASLCRSPGGNVTTCGPGDSPLALGDPVPANYGSVVTATRLVTVGDRDAVVVVRLW